MKFEVKTFPVQLVNISGNRMEPQLDTYQPPNEYYIDDEEVDEETFDIEYSKFEHEAFCRQVRFNKLEAEAKRLANRTLWERVKEFFK